MPSEQLLPMPEGTGVSIRVFEPAQVARAVVVIPSAMGVAQQYYARFAEWLASRQYVAMWPLVPQWLAA